MFPRAIPDHAWRLAVLLGLCAAMVPPAYGDAGATTPPACTGPAAITLSFHRAMGSQTGTLAWRVSTGAEPASYRVFSNGRKVGETPGRSIEVEVRPGSTYVFIVRRVDASGSLSSCAGRMKQEVRYYGPSAPLGLAVTDVAGRHARLVWSPGNPGDGRIAGYRVYRDGRTFKRARGLSLRVAAGGGVRSFRVAAADARGHVSALSGRVKVVPGHYAPGRPGRLKASRVTDSKVALSWSKASARKGRLTGYRIYRDGVPLRQVKGTATVARDLAPATGYRFVVAAIDTQGYMSSFSGQVSVKTTTPPPTQGRTHAFLLASTGESFRDLQRHYRQIGTVYPTYFDCQVDTGAIVGNDDPLITRWAMLRRIQVLPRFNCQETGTLHSILTDQKLRAATLAGLVNLVREHGYDGINIDFEKGLAADRDALTAFVSSLGGRLHGIGKRVSVEVSPKYDVAGTGRSAFYDYAALGRVADRVFVMNWGWHWETSDPGAPDDMEMCRKVADYVASMPNKSRFVLGTQLYGLDWPNGGGPQKKAAALEHSDVSALIARYGAQPVLDPLSDSWVFDYVDGAGARHEVWFPDAATIARRIRLARERGLGVGFWRLGEEDPRVWNDAQIAAGSSWP